MQELELSVEVPVHNEELHGLRICLAQHFHKSTLRTEIQKFLGLAWSWLGGPSCGSSAFEELDASSSKVVGALASGVAGSRWKGRGR